MSEEGVRTGLWIWLVFVIGFFVIGYPAEFSILIGAIAGLAAGFIRTFQKAQPTSKDESKKEDKDTFVQRAKRRFWKLGSRGENAPVTTASSKDPWKVKSRKRRNTL